MAKQQNNFNKKELEKRKLQKRKEKQERKEERKASTKGQSFEDMIMYVDENGNFTSTPPDPTKKKSIAEEDIVIGSRNTGQPIANTERRGKVTFFNDSKGFGFIKDSESGDSIFVHVKGTLDQIKENDTVTFETERGPKGLNAINVKLASK